MKGILWKISVLTLALIGCYYFFMGQLTQGFVNENYSKFTHQSPSLIIGLSRAHNGIDPSVLDSVLDGTPYEGGFLNFAFEKSQSPYGKIYFEAIKKKIPKQTTKGVYILTVSPGSFSAPVRITSVEQIIAFDQNSLLGKIGQLNKNPNYEYIRKGYGGSLYKGFLPNNPQITTVFHDNGWEEFKLFKGSYHITEEDIANWTSQTIGGYRLIMKEHPEKASTYRMGSFQQIISFLKQHGQVFVVRMPIDPLVLGLENKLWKEFNTEMTLISAKKDVPYFDFSDATQYKTYDGSHLSSIYAKEFSERLALEIQRYYRTPSF
ncbi:hypothetical protein [Galbibacter sp.]|uniref:hypothetical protein n=1 Tax=Galbibacter sp. TaxID=2918471 RepID=UPI003A8FE2B4